MVFQVNETVVADSNDSPPTQAGSIAGEGAPATSPGYAERVDPPDDGNSTVWVVVGIVLGIAVVAIITLATVLYRRRR